jgi:hypothetical protein
MGPKDSTDTSIPLSFVAELDELTEASTSIPPTPTKSGLVMAKIILSAAMFASDTIFTPRGFKSGFIAPYMIESSTAISVIDPQLKQEVRRLFDQGAYEFFQDGMSSPFSQSLLSMLALHGQDALREIADYMFTVKAKPDVVSETLRQIADHGDRSNLAQRWHILERTLKDNSPRVRDGAILGFAALDDPGAQGLLLEARTRENIHELRVLIDQVVAQLGRTR